MKTKKSQFLLFAIINIVLFMVFIYYLENNNDYKPFSQDLDMIQSFEIEVCNLVKSSNDSYISSNLDNLNDNMLDFCPNFKTSCSLDYFEDSNNPISYQNYSIFINYTNEDLFYYSGIVC